MTWKPRSEKLQTLSQEDRAIVFQAVLKLEGQRLVKEKQDWAVDTDGGDYSVWSLGPLLEAPRTSSS